MVSYLSGSSFVICSTTKRTIHGSMEQVAVYSTRVSLSIEERANAYLMAASPALLKQVEKDAKVAHHSYCPVGFPQDHAPECQVYRDLIAKAGGA